MPIVSYTRDEVEFYLGTHAMMTQNLGTANDMVGLHFQLSCYVCGPGCTKPSPFEGWATFVQIFQQRPDRCRFAVARMVPLLHGTAGVTSHDAPVGDYLVWDLLADKLVANVQGTLTAPLPLWQGETEDAMVMKCFMMYDHG